jgi:hypothetical protein
LGKRGDGAIVASFGLKREHPRIANALVTGFFHIYFFRGKYLSGVIGNSEDVPSDGLKPIC